MKKIIQDGIEYSHNKCKLYVQTPGQIKQNKTYDPLAAKTTDSKNFYVLLRNKASYKLSAKDDSENLTQRL